MDLAAADSKTKALPEVKTNYNPEKNGNLEYLYGEDALAKLKVAPGYKIELFASEKEFTDVANPVQLSFDNKGRLWLATMPTYPHWKPGDKKPNDKIIILEDTNQDGKADKQTVFADGLHLPLGFELAPEGVYLSQGTNFYLLRDTDGDDKADTKEILLSGFDDHDTHHAHHAYTVDPSGAIYMGEGVFLHTNVETSYGPVRATNGGFYRYNPQRRQLERTAQLSIPNPWGIAFDEWGQNFFAETSSPDVRWMMPGSVKSRYGVSTHKSKAAG
jgi:putative membrane-bound dehydrogenase-like protein